MTCNCNRLHLSVYSKSTVIFAIKLGVLYTTSLWDETRFWRLGFLYLGCYGYVCEDAICPSVRVKSR